MNWPEKSRVRPEEAIFALLLGLVLGMHLVVGEPYFIFQAVRESWAESAWFRLATLGGVTCAAALAFLFWGGGTRIRACIAGPAGFIRDFLPFGYMFIIYESVHSIAPKFRGRIFDDVLMSADQLLFQRDVFLALPAAILGSHFARPAIFLLAFCYSAVFVVYWALALYFYFCYSRDVFRRYMLSVVLTSYLGYAFYLLVPALGPYEAFVRPGILDFGFWSGIGYAGAISTFADCIRGFHFDKVAASDAFPSLHTAWAVIVLIFAAAHARGLLWLLAPWACGTVLGALFFQQHYVIDIMAGAPAAFTGIAVAVWLTGGPACGRTAWPATMPTPPLRGSYAE